MSSIVSISSACPVPLCVGAAVEDDRPQLPRGTLGGLPRCWQAGQALIWCGGSAHTRIQSAVGDELVLTLISAVVMSGALLRHPRPDAVDGHRRSPRRLHVVL